MSPDLPQKALQISPEKNVPPRRFLWSYRSWTSRKLINTSRYNGKRKNPCTSSSFTSARDLSAGLRTERRAHPETAASYGVSVRSLAGPGESAANGESSGWHLRNALAGFFPTAGRPNRSCPRLVPVLTMCSLLNLSKEYRISTQGIRTPLTHVHAGRTMHRSVSRVRLLKSTSLAATR